MPVITIQATLTANPADLESCLRISVRTWPGGPGFVLDQRVGHLFRRRAPPEKLVSASRQRGRRGRGDGDSWRGERCWVTLWRPWRCRRCFRGCPGACAEAQGACVFFFFSDSCCWWRAGVFLCLFLSLCRGGITRQQSTVLLCSASAGL
jgi:hypothetical protein